MFVHVLTVSTLPSSHHSTYLSCCVRSPPPPRNFPALCLDFSEPAVFPSSCFQAPIQTCIHAETPGKTRCTDWRRTNISNYPVSQHTHTHRHHPSPLRSSLPLFVPLLHKNIQKRVFLPTDSVQDEDTLTYWPILKIARGEMDKMTFPLVHIISKRVYQSHKLFFWGGVYYVSWVFMLFLLLPRSHSLLPLCILSPWRAYFQEYQRFLQGQSPWKPTAAMNIKKVPAVPLPL